METCCKEKPNYGKPPCVEDFGVIVKAILVPSKKEDGTKNIYNLNDLDYTEIMSKFYAAQDERWYPLPDLENVTPPTPADTQFEDGASGRKYRLRDGIISFAGELLEKNALAPFKSKLDTVRCSEWSVFFISNTNKIIGSVVEVDGVDYFAPIPIDTNSFDPKFMWKSDAKSQTIMVAFDLARKFKDSTYYTISGTQIWDSTDEIVKTIDFTDLPQIIDCDLKVSGATTTAVDITINTDFRQGTRITGVNNAGDVNGLDAIDFVVTNVTDDTVITPSGVTENDGVYSFVYAAQTSGERMRIELAIDNTELINYAGKVEYLIP